MIALCPVSLRLGLGGSGGGGLLLRLRLRLRDVLPDHVDDVGVTLLRRHHHDLISHYFSGTRLRPIC